MTSKPISKHLKKIVDDLITSFGISETLRRADNLQKVNTRLYEDHVAANEKVKAMSVQKNISINNKAIEYLKQLKENEVLKEYKSLTEAFTETGIKRTNISNCLTGLSKSAGGYRWKYKNNINN